MVNGLEYLWQSDPEYWNGQAPILFPICGSLRNDWAIYRPQERPFFTGLIRRHGFVRKEEFTLEEVNENSVTFSIKPNAEMLDNYLYQFELRVVYTLNGKSIRTEFQVTNLEMEKAKSMRTILLNLVRLSLARYQRVFLRQDY